MPLMMGVDIETRTLVKVRASSDVALCWNPE